jgi:hypothetical protein
MQEEVNKHTRKIFKEIKNKEHSFGEKLKEVTIEILIIVFAVTLSIWLHSWSEHRHEQKQVKKFLTGLREDLKKDIVLLEENKAILARVDSDFEFLYDLIIKKQLDTQTDSVLYSKTRYQILETHLNVGRFEGFKSSGKLETIETDSLKEKILVFYQQTLPDLLAGEVFNNSLQMKILDTELDESDSQSKKKILSSQKVGALIHLLIYNSDIALNDYSNTIAGAKELINDIDKELKH